MSKTDGCSRNLKRESLLRPWVVYLIHHSHNDVGYTHLPIIAGKKQLDYLDQVVELCGKDKKFKWNCESAWVAEQYLLKRDKKQIRKLRNCVQSGQVEICGSYLNFQLVPDDRLMSSATRRSVEAALAFGACPKSAMIVDVNGVAGGWARHWSKAGIHRLHISPNAYSAIPFPDRPAAFWWKGIGEERVLVYVGMQYHSANCKGLLKSYKQFGEWIQQWLASLEARQDSLRIAALCFSGEKMDNAPPSPIAVEWINKWNTENNNPRLVLAKNTEFFNELERQYGRRLPAFSGDWPDWWADGIESVPTEISFFLSTRRTSRVLEKFGWKPSEEFGVNQLLAAEHTRGAAGASYFPFKRLTLIHHFNSHQCIWRSVLELQEAVEKLLSETRHVIGAEEKQHLLIAENDNLPELLKVPWNDPIGEITSKEESKNIIQVLEDADGTRELCIPKHALIRKGKAWLFPDDVRLSFGESPRHTHAINSNKLMLKISPSGADIESLASGRKNILTRVRDFGFGRLIIDIPRGGRKRYDEHVPKEDAIFFWGAGTEKSMVPLHVDRHTVESSVFESGMDGHYASERCYNLRIAPAAIAKIKYRLFHPLNRIDVFISLKLKDPQRPMQVLLETSWGKTDVLLAKVPGGIINPREDRIKGTCCARFVCNEWVALLDEKRRAVQVISADTPLYQSGEICTNQWPTNPLGKPGNLWFVLYNNLWSSNFHSGNMGMINSRFSIYFHEKWNPDFAERLARQTLDCPVSSFALTPW